MCEQSATFSLIWDSKKRGFTGIVTLRNILEVIVSICETIEQVHAENMKSLSDDGAHQSSAQGQALNVN